MHPRMPPDTVTRQPEAVMGRGRCRPRLSQTTAGCTTATVCPMHPMKPVTCDVTFTTDERRYHLTVRDPMAKPPLAGDLRGHRAPAPPSSATADGVYYSDTLIFEATVAIPKMPPMRSPSNGRGELAGDLDGDFAARPTPAVRCSTKRTYHLNVTDSTGKAGSDSVVCRGSAELGTHPPSPHPPMGQPVPKATTCVQGTASDVDVASTCSPRHGRATKTAWAHRTADSTAVGWPSAT